MAAAAPSPERIVHFVFGLRPQIEPFHLLHYLCLESCRRVVEPDRIVVHLHHLPFGPYWDLIRPHIEIDRIAPVAEVSRRPAPAEIAPYIYAHHADVIRLEVLARHGGMYADMDTMFVNPVPTTLWSRPFVIGVESGEPDGVPAAPERSLCNALMLSRPGSRFLEIWRTRIVGEMDGSWSNHSCRLAARLAAEHPDLVTIEPERSFTAYRHTISGIARLVEHEVDEVDTDGVYSIHLWAHLWWDRARTDFSEVDATWFTEPNIASGRRALALLARPYLPIHRLW